MTPQSIAVALVGMGPIGAEVVRLIRSKPWVRLVAVVDVDPGKVGRDVADLAGLSGRTGVLVERELTADAQVVIHCTGSALKDVELQLRSLLEQGCRVVSSCEELAYPLDGDLHAALDQAARRNGVALLGTGVNPGFVMDKLPLTLTAVCQEIRAVEVVRVVDASRRRDSLQRKVGAGMSVGQFEQSVRSGAIRHVGLKQSLMLLARGLGVTLQHVGEELIRPVIADGPVLTQALRVERGQVAGVHQRVHASGQGKNFTLDLKIYVGAREPKDEIFVTGTPDISMTIPGGIHGDRATAAMLVNAIPRIMEAHPGLRTMDDISISWA